MTEALMTSSRHDPAHDPGHDPGGGRPAAADDPPAFARAWEGVLLPVADAARHLPWVSVMALYGISALVLDVAVAAFDVPGEPGRCLVLEEATIAVPAAWRASHPPGACGFYGRLARRMVRGTDHPAVWEVDRRGHPCRLRLGQSRTVFGHHAAELADRLRPGIYGHLRWILSDEEGSASATSGPNPLRLCGPAVEFQYRHPHVLVGGRGVEGVVRRLDRGVARPMLWRALHRRWRPGDCPAGPVDIYDESTPPPVYRVLPGAVMNYCALVHGDGMGELIRQACPATAFDPRPLEPELTVARRSRVDLAAASGPTPILEYRPADPATPLRPGLRPGLATRATRAGHTGHTVRTAPDPGKRRSRTMW